MGVSRLTFNNLPRKTVYVRKNVLLSYLLLKKNDALVLRKTWSPSQMYIAVVFGGQS